MAKRVLTGIPLTAYWPYGSDNWNTEMDTNLLLLSALANCAVASRVTVIDGAADKTKLFLVPSIAEFNANKIAIYNNDVATPANSGWVYITPKEGWTAYVIDEAAPLDFLYGAWAPSQFTFSKAYMTEGYNQRWITGLSVNAAFTQIAGAQVTRYRKAMTLVNLQFELSTAALQADNVTILTLPVDHRPPLPIRLPLASNLGSARVLVGTDGTVKTIGFTAAGSFSLNTNFSTF